MGRKIPGKKHRGVKDPLKQHARREAELESKINAPPKDADEQTIPRSLERLVKLKEAAATCRITKNKKHKKKSQLICVGQDNATKLHPKAKPDKVVPVFKQKPDETPERFFFRVSRETQAFINETAFEKKYGVQVNRNPETGRVEGISKAQKDELDEIEKLRAKHRNIKKKKKKTQSELPVMTKAQKRKEKLKLKKQKKQTEERDEFEDFKDEVKFGEIVHAPPQLKTKPNKADPATSSKPGKKDLLLHSLLQGANSAKTCNVAKTIVDRAGKRKNLPIGERRQLEKQQSAAIEAYRRLKAQRLADAES